VVPCLIIGIGSTAMGIGIWSALSGKNGHAIEPLESTVEATVVSLNHTVITAVPRDPPRHCITNPEETTSSTDASADNTTEPPLKQSAAHDKTVVESN